jgi:hypothetical protein
MEGELIMPHYKCCPVVLIFMLGLFFGSCVQPGGPSSEDLNKTDDIDQEYPEGWEDWEEVQPDPPKVEGIVIAAMPNITIFPNNVDPATLNFEGLVVHSVWDNGETKLLSKDNYSIDKSRITPFLGEATYHQVVINWTDPDTNKSCQAEFTVRIDSTNRVLSRVTASGSLPSTQKLNFPFDFGTLKLTGIYTENQVDTPVPFNNTGVYRVSGYDMRKRGDQTVSIMVNGVKPEGVDTYPVTVRVPANATVKAPTIPGQYIPGKTSSYKPIYLKGQEFSLANAGLTVTVTANSQTTALTYGNGGVTATDLEDPNDVLDADGTFAKTGNQTLRLKLDDAPAVDVPFYVIGDVDGVMPRVYFDYGYRQTETDKTGKGWGDGKYYVKSGSSITLAPVRYLIGYKADHTNDGASYTWTVDGASVANTGASYTFTPSAQKTYTVGVSVTGRNFITGLSDTKTATAEVVCYSGTISSTKTFQGPLKDFAPGQFTERGTGYGWSLGAILGYEIWDATNGSSATSVTQAKITGNAFASWSEPGIVWVQPDDNGNGIPDETWYELLGSAKNNVTRRFALTYIRDALSEAPPNEYGQIIRTIYWTDQRGRVGIIGGGWPAVGNDKGINGVAGTWITYTGTILGDSGGLQLNSGGSSGGSGYVDSFGGNDLFYPRDAVNADGTSAGLTSFRFIKVQCAYFEYGDAFGERSTEIVSGTGLAGQSGGFPLP